MAVAMADEDMLSLLQFPLDDDDLLELFGCCPHTPENSAWEKQSSAPCAVLDADSVKVHRTIGGVLPQTSVESGLAPPRYSTWNFGHLLGLATRSDEKSSSHNISDAGSSEGYCGRRNSAEGERERERVNSIVELEIADQKGMEGSDSRKANKEEHESLTISTVTCGGAVSTTEAGMEPFDSTYSTEKSGREAGSSVKRKAINRDDFEYQSKDMEDASVQLKKPHSGTSKRRATEIHNQSERRRRDRINEKMRELQALVPNANKTDKASMLDEAIQYLKFLQVQLQIMSIRTGMSIPPMMLPTGMAHLEQTSLFPQTQAGMRMNMVNFGTASTSHLTASLPITSTSFLPGLVCQSNVLQRQSPAPINSLNTNIHMCNVTLQQWQAHQIDPSQLQNNT